MGELKRLMTFLQTFNSWKSFTENTYELVNKFPDWRLHSNYENNLEDLGNMSVNQGSPRTLYMS